MLVLKLPETCFTRLCVAMMLGAVPALVCSPAIADKIRHPTAVFSGLDKITGRIIGFDVTIDETVQFGSLQITARVCYTRPATEAPQTTSFVEVDELTSTNEYKRIFSGWMFAASPGLHGIEHPVYDVWLTDCKGGTEVIPTPQEVPEQPEIVQDTDPSKGGKPAQRKPRQQPPQQQQDQGLFPQDPLQSRDPFLNGNQPRPQRPQNQPLPPSQNGQLPGPLVPPGNVERRTPTQRFFPTGDPAPLRDPAGR